MLKIPRKLLGWTGILATFVGCAQAAGPQSASPVQQTGSPYRTVLNRYCITCHNEKLRTAELLLDKADVDNVGHDAAVWEKVVRKLRTGAMPPAGVPRPEKATYDSFATYLETELDRAAAARPNPGRPAVHRLNRAEYANAIRDLLAIDVDGESLLSADDSGYGFDNIGDVLSVSPMLLERYMIAAGKIARLAIGDATIAPALQKYDVPQLLTQDDRMNEDMPFGSRGGVAIRHFFPLDGEYVIKIEMQRTRQDRILGLAKPHQFEVRLDGARIKLLTIGGESKGESAYNSAIGYRGDPAQEQYERNADADLEVRFSSKAGSRLISVGFLDESAVPEGSLQSDFAAFTFLNKRVDEILPGIGSVTVGGPYNAKGPGDTPSRRKIFVCRPAASNEEDPCAGKIFSTLAHRAYRRPLTDADVRALLSLYKTGRTKGGFEAGIEMALQAMLVSPDFLFRVERDPANLAGGASYRISDLELASRLSFFLWSSIPDEELLALAERGQLQNPGVLDQQVRRMLGDSRSKALVDNFAGQWLYLRNIRSATPDPEEFPEFDENLREGFLQETELFFESMLREDRSLVDLLNADYTFVNERLARHYGIPSVYGSRFRRVTLKDENRRGLLGQGSILTVTSYANRTSPVLRGKWLLENVLGTPPPPPPPNVPSLKDTGKGTKALSMRERMEQHRANPACAVCHTRMDPLGFALENYNAIARWRTTEGAASKQIDSSGALPDGTKFQGPAELRKVLLRQPDQFVTTVTEKLLTYSLGRGVEYFDAPSVRKIIRDAAPMNYRWSSIILGIVKSTPFQMRRSPES